MYPIGRRSPTLAEPVGDLRPGVVDSVERAWDRLGCVGRWFDSEQRRTLVSEVRNAAGCRLCTDRRSAVSPFAANGDHAAVGAVPAIAVDAVHRITTDPGRLSSVWYQRCLHDGLTPGEVVELTALTAITRSVDTFCRGLGQAPPPPPHGREGTPNRTDPPGAEVHSARVPTVPADAASERVAELYARSPMALEGQVPNIVKALSICPDDADAFMAMMSRLYSGELNGSPDGWRLTRVQIEWTASVVSNHNECFY